jgi:hypothetical protein
MVVIWWKVVTTRGMTTSALEASDNLPDPYVIAPEIVGSAERFSQSALVLAFGSYF